MVADDRAYLVRMVEQRTGLAPPQAEARVSAIVAKSREALLTSAGRSDPRDRSSD
jgi:hypothetical protein